MPVLASKDYAQCDVMFFQDDVVMGTLSVRENLRFSAALRLPSSVSKQEREQRVEDVITELGLADCANTRVRLSHNLVIPYQQIIELIPSPQSWQEQAEHMKCTQAP